MVNVSHRQKEEEEEKPNVHRTNENHFEYGVEWESLGKSPKKGSLIMLQTQRIIAAVREHPTSLSGYYFVSATATWAAQA